MQNKKIAIQDTYKKRFQHCWGCGPQNEEGLHLKSYPSEDGKTCICKFKPDKRYTGGVPDNLFGGMIAMIFDCHGTASAAWFAHNNKKLSYDENTVIGRFITARLEIDFKKPLPIDKELLVSSFLEELTDRKAIITMEMISDGLVRARAKMVAVAVKDDM